MIKHELQDARPRFAIVYQDVIESDASAMAKLAYMVIAFHARQERTGFPSYKRIAELMSASKRTAQRAVKELADRGLVSVERRKNSKNEWTSNTYTLSPLGVTQSHQVVTQSHQVVTQSHHPSDTESPGYSHSDTLRLELKNRTEEKVINNNNSTNGKPAAVAPLSNSKIFLSLKAKGFEEPTRTRLAKLGISTDTLNAWWEYANGEDNISHPIGFTSRMLLDGIEAPAPRPKPHDYTDGITILE